MPRDTVTRCLAHEAFGPRPTTLLVRVCRYRWEHCGRIWQQDTTKAATPRARISRGGLTRVLTEAVVDHLTVSRVAAGLGVSWGAANDAKLAEGKRRPIKDPHRFDTVTTIGVYDNALAEPLNSLYRSDGQVWINDEFGRLSPSP